jgi:hypothetical protein
VGESGATGAACADAAASVATATANAKTVLFIEILLERERVFALRTTRQQRVGSQRSLYEGYEMIRVRCGMNK